MRNTILQELHSLYEQRQRDNQYEEERRKMEATSACPEIGNMIEARQNLIFSSILGIGQEDGAAGYRQLRIVPQIPKNLPRASGSLRLPAGETAVAWKKEADKIHFSITTPQDTTATFVYGGNEYPLTETDNNFTFAIE